MKKVVISLGGSLIIPDQIDYEFLSNFRKILRKHYRTHKFILVCGGGSIARKYISALRKDGKNIKEQSLAGIMCTRMNATFLMHFFGKEANSTLPMSMKEVENNIGRNNVVLCGALRYAPDETSDSTAAKLANYLKTDFINLTDVQGLYTKNPKKFKSAKFIPEISWNDFAKMAGSLKYEAGQHFVLDQDASNIIKKDRIKTFIVGKSTENLDNLLSNKKFVGTTING